MTLPPRAVLVHRRTELQELLQRHGTRGQAAFFLETRGRRIEDVEDRHRAVQAAITAATSAIPVDWYRGLVERDDLPRFLFAPGDIIVAVGQDGLVANIAKYLDGQVVIGINPEPGRNPGILVPHPPGAAAALLAAAASPHASERAERHAMVEAVTDDRQRLAALNEIYIGQASHQTARRARRAAGLLGAYRLHRHWCHRLVPVGLAGAEEHPGPARPGRPPAHLVRPRSLALAGDRHHAHRGRPRRRAVADGHGRIRPARPVRRRHRSRRDPPSLGPDRHHPPIRPDPATAPLAPRPVRRDVKQRRIGFEHDRYPVGDHG
jgi:hypothetical protein